MSHSAAVLAIIFGILAAMEISEYSRRKIFETEYVYKR
jgi:hypothetical protein